MYMKANWTALLAVSLLFCGCGLSPSIGAPSQTSSNPVIVADSLKGDVQQVLDRAIAQDDVIMGEAGKTSVPAEQVRLTKQAYYILFGAVSEINMRAQGVNLNPLDAKKRKQLLDESADALWKLRYLDKEGSSKPKDAETQLALYDRLHSEAYNTLNKLQAILKGKA